MPLTRGSWEGLRLHKEIPRRRLCLRPEVAASVPWAAAAPSSAELSAAPGSPAALAARVARSPSGCPTLTAGAWGAGGGGPLLHRSPRKLRVRQRHFPGERGRRSAACLSPCHRERRVNTDPTLSMTASRPQDPPQALADALAFSGGARGRPVLLVPEGTPARGSSSANAAVSASLPRVRDTAPPAGGDPFFC